MAAYLPFAFQRKMIMGTHLPLALLAGLAVAELARRAGQRLGPKLPGISFGTPTLVAGIFVLALAPSNLRFMLRDVRVAETEGVTSTRAHPVYWPTTEVRALEWLGRHSPPDAGLLTMPTVGVIAPAYSGRAVYAGHWGETPDFKGRLQQALAFYDGRGGSEERRRFLVENRVTYVLWGPLDQSLFRATTGRDPARALSAEPFLQPAYTDGATVLYGVR